MTHQGAVLTGKIPPLAKGRRKVFVLPLSSGGIPRGAETGMGDLFRKEMLRAQRGQWMGAINLATPLAFVWWVLLAAALAAAIVLFLIFGQYTRRAEVPGQLEPSVGLLTLSAKTTGIVARTLVHEGQQVTIGQPLVEVSANLVSA